MAKTGTSIEYPPECKEVTIELSKDELHRRLKQLAKCMQEIGQDDSHQKYNGLALHMAGEEFLEHDSKDIKILVACILADVFRIFAPEHPFGNTEKLKEVLMFLIDQLTGLDNPQSHNYKRYFYLLENLTFAKTFTVCLDWEDDSIVLHLLNTVFGSLKPAHTEKVIGHFVDALSSVLSDADSVSIPVLDAVFINLVEPNRSLAPEAHHLAKKLLQRNADNLASSIMSFFSQTMMLGNTNESDVGEKLMDVILELSKISHTLITNLAPFLDQKLKANDIAERRTVIKLLGHIFADENTNTIDLFPDLWQSYLGRYHDIETEVRLLCIEQAENILIKNPESKAAITEHWNRRHRDAEDNVRCAVVQAIINTSKKGLKYVTDEMLQCVKERCLDKKFKIRKEALTGLGALFRKYAITDDGSVSGVEIKEKIHIQWIQNRILQTYFQRLLDDKFMVERLLLQCIVPFTLPTENRMKRLLTMFAYIDENSRKALSTMFRAQTQLRKLVKELVDLTKQENTPKLVHQIAEQAVRIAKYYPDSGNKVAEGLKKFFTSLPGDEKSRELLDAILDPKCSCEAASLKSKALQNKLTQDKVPQSELMAVKVLLERVAPLLIDQEAVDVLVRFIVECMEGTCEFMSDYVAPHESGMNLLVILAPEYPQAFDSQSTFNHLTELLQHENDTVSSAALQVLMNTGSSLKEKFPGTCELLMNTLINMVKIGTPKQAKHAIRCLANMFDNKEQVFDGIAEYCETNLSLDSANFVTAIVALGHMAELAPKSTFVTRLKPIVQNVLIKDLLMQDQTVAKVGRRTMELWTSDHLVSEETKAKIQAMKMMTRWLHAIVGTDLAEKYCSSTLRLLSTVLHTNGDLMENKRIPKGEMSRLRLTATLCMLKLVHVGQYAELVSNEQFQVLALVINDPVVQVRIAFTQKLHKHLLAMKIPLQYMAIFALSANDRVKERKQTVKQYIELNISKRREYLKKHPASNNRVLFSLLPDYVIPYAVHLLAHDPELEGYEDAPTLRNIKECLWLLLEPLMKEQTSFYTFQKKIFEYIKQTKDAQSPEDMVANQKMWAICDLGIQIISQRCPFNSRAASVGTPLLPAKLFTGLDKTRQNSTVYLPRDLVFSPSRGSASRTNFYAAGDTKEKKGGDEEDGDSYVDVLPKILEPEAEESADKQENVNEAGDATITKRGTKRPGSANDEKEQVMTKKQRAARAAAAGDSEQNGKSDENGEEETESKEVRKTRSSARNK